MRRKPFFSQCCVIRTLQLPAKQTRRQLAVGTHTSLNMPYDGVLAHGWSCTNLVGVYHLSNVLLIRPPPNLAVAVARQVARILFFPNTAHPQLTCMHLNGMGPR